MKLEDFKEIKEIAYSKGFKQVKDRDVVFAIMYLLNGRHIADTYRMVMYEAAVLNKGNLQTRATKYFNHPQTTLLVNLVQDKIMAKLVASYVNANSIMFPQFTRKAVTTIADTENNDLIKEGEIIKLVSDMLKDAQKQVKDPTIDTDKDLISSVKSLVQIYVDKLGGKKEDDDSPIIMAYDKYNHVCKYCGHEISVHPKVAALIKELHEEEVKREMEEEGYNFDN